jgi:AAA+ ATPase superfamily predicted ATPase
MIQIKENPAPKLKMPSFSVDGELHPRLNDFEVTKLMNKNNFTLFLGKAGSGKTSLMTGLIGTKKGGFKHIFDTIFVFMPASSRSSMKDSFFDKYLPPDQLFDELTHTDLQQAYDIAKENASEGLRTLMIFDDVQKSIKGECERLFLSIVNNRRHALINIFLCCQNYFSIPKLVRSGLTSIFCFKSSKEEMEAIFIEQIEQHRKLFMEIMKLCFKKPHDFLFIDTNSQRLFTNFDEIIISEK